MNWFQRHLNWTAVFGCVIGYCFQLFSVINVGFYFLGVLLALPIFIWVLKQKRQSLWWILVLFIPAGFLIIYLPLSNRGISKTGGEVYDIVDGKIIKRARTEQDLEPTEESKGPNPQNYLSPPDN